MSRAWKWRRAVLWFWLNMLLAGCAGTPSPALETPVAPSATPAKDSEAAPPPSPRAVPSVYPTATQPPTLPAATPGPTRTPALPATSLDDVAVRVRLSASTIALARRLEATLGGQVQAADKTSGLSAARANQSNLVREMQLALGNLRLEPVPADCAGCVLLEAELPSLERQVTGWLRDPVLLASLENYFALLLGPHFPPGTAVGLRRSASPYDVAQTVALTEDGRRYLWKATAGEIPAPTSAPDDLPALAAALAGAALLPNGYVAACANVPVETLVVALEGAPVYVPIICPALALPSTLVPAYQWLDRLFASQADEAAPPAPAPALPLAAVLVYQRQDGARATLRADGQLGLQSPAAAMTVTVSASQMLSWTAALSATGLLAPGAEPLLELTEASSPSTRASAPARATVGLRLPAGVVSLSWSGPTPAPLAAALAELDVRLDALAPTSVWRRPRSELL